MHERESDSVFAAVYGVECGAGRAGRNAWPEASTLAPHRDGDARPSSIPGSHFCGAPVFAELREGGWLASSGLLRVNTQRALAQRVFHVVTRLQHQPVQGSGVQRTCQPQGFLGMDGRADEHAADVPRGYAATARKLVGTYGVGAHEVVAQHLTG